MHRIIGSSFQSLSIPVSSFCSLLLIAVCHAASGLTVAERLSGSGCSEAQKASAA